MEYESISCIVRDYKEKSFVFLIQKLYSYDC